ncbi:Saposin B type domain [Arabidopsis suecica]|uniref:Saposin B type domain n=1 Tax=Arabidopsis suecica TaxID=45249 RepID=A0A8T1YI47_ARASU|nr:Saposin B type domain [Arabidopsis suecica]
MVVMNRVLIALTLALLASSALLPVSDAAKKPSSAPRKEDVPYIKCQVCEKLASRLHQLVKEKQQQISPKKISEYEIIEIAENVCNLKKEEADWMLKIDIVEKGDKLVLVEQAEEGMCNSKCKTIENACQKVIGYSDTDVSEYIYKSKPDLVSLVNHLCKDLTDACSKKPPPVHKDRVPGEPFVAKPSKDAEMDKILRSMQGMPGAPGMKVYSREDIEKGNIGNEEDDGDDDEDEEEDEKFPKNLGKVLKEKESKTEELKKTIAKEFKKKGEVLKKHAQKVSNRVRRWWKGLRTSSSKKSKSGKSEL